MAFKGDRHFGGVRRDRVFKVYLTMPEGAAEDEVMDYIEDAVATWKGQLHPDNPIFDLDPDSVSVRRRSPKYKECK